MNNLQRVGAVVTGILMLITGAILFWFPEKGTYIVAFILAAALFLMGAQLLIYYFTMARRMVGGKSVLLLGIFLLDFCAFTVTILDEPGVPARPGPTGAPGSSRPSPALSKYVSRPPVPSTGAICPSSP